MRDDSQGGYPPGDCNWKKMEPMGAIRKLTSVSTLGAVKYTSRREAQTKAASAEARLAKEEAKSARASRRAAEHEQAAEQAEGKPWYRQPTLGAAIRSAGHKDAGHQEGDDIAGKLRQLSELHETGLLTDAEYEDKRAALAGRL